MSTATITALRTYQFDRAHSDVTFSVRHLLTKVRGRFTDHAGTLEFDPADPTSSKVSFTVQATSIDTAEPKRDAHLRSADFFDVERFPTLTFVSTGITARGGNAFDVEGDLTIHGVTRRITLPVTYLGVATDPWGNEKLSFEAQTTVNRKDYGLNWNAVLEAGGFVLGDEVTISLDIQAA